MVANHRHRAWTLKEYQYAVKLRRSGLTYAEIADALGRSKNGVVNKLIHDWPKPAPREYPHKPPSPAALAHHAYRCSLEPRDLTAQIMGDPLPGYSALDRRGR